MSQITTYVDMTTTNGQREEETDNDATEIEFSTDHIDQAFSDFPVEKPYSVAIKEYPVTEERKPYVPKAGDVLRDAGTARATIAATNEKPNGTTENNWARDHAHQTIIVQHCDYFDRDHDGIIWPQDTYIGFRNFGWGLILSIYATFLINAFLSYPTSPSILPDPFFRIYLQNIHKDKHGSDSMSYDNEGRFRPQNFEDFFAKYDQEGKGGLTWRDFMRAWKGQAFVFDFFGWSATFFEWLATYLLLWPEDGVMRKEDVRGIFDGSIFYKKAEEHKQKQVMAKQAKNRKSRSHIN
ncbi:MAG: hypothetical protein M1827_001854 [Pycnora praestabilis]|nr:MAG: hypothetical protein M1827_001854 [Pycnora praestabilis]